MIAGTVRGYISVYNMRYPLLIKLWKQSDDSAITSMKLSQQYDCKVKLNHRFTTNPEVWTASGENRAYLWNVSTGECSSSIQVNDYPTNKNVSLLDIKINVGLVMEIVGFDF